MTFKGIRQFKALLAQKLEDIYPKEEIRQLAKLLLQDAFNMSSTQLLLLDDDALSAEQRKKLEEAVNRLSQSEPLQYILGYTEFYDLKLNVSPSVLIPRPETEELVHWILNDPDTNKQNILDVGTGSGCIPLALKNNLPDAYIEAWDISEEALMVARENAINLKLDVSFKQVDVLKCAQVDQPFTCIVSNPPYVRHLEKEMMDANVLRHEPHLALFVENNDPLLFYHTIAKLGLNALETNGSLFFEINEYLEEQMTSLLLSLGYKNIECRKDLQGKARMIKAKRQ